MLTVDTSKLSSEHTWLLNKISYEIRQDYIHIFDNLTDHFNDNLDWHFSAVASKDLHQTESFFTLSLLMLITKLNEREKLSKVIVKNDALAKVLKNHFPELTIEAIDKSLSLGKISMELRLGLRNFLYVFFRILWINAFRKYERGQHNKAEVLVDTFILDSSIKGSDYKDRWYTGMTDLLQVDQKFKVAMVPTLIMKPWKIKNCLKLQFKDRFLFKESFLRVQDYAWALNHRRRVRKLRIPKVMFCQMDVTEILQQELRLNARSQASIKACLNYRFVKNLIASGREVRTFIDWNENQIIDKSINLAFKHFSSETTIHGYRSFIQTDQYVHMMPTNKDLEMGFFPKAIYTSGQPIADAITEFTSAIELKKAPAFRFAGMFDNLEDRSKNGKTFEILVALPIDVETSQSILNSLLSIREFANPLYKIVIRPHPNYSSNYITTLFPPNMDYQPQFSRGTFQEAVVSADLLISTQSSSCLESICCGTPVIVFAGDSGFIMNPIPKTVSSDFYIVALSEEAVLEFTKKVASNEIKISEADRVNLINTCFEPVSKELVEDFLNL